MVMVAVDPEPIPGTPAMSWDCAVILSHKARTSTPEGNSAWPVHVLAGLEETGEPRGNPVHGGEYMQDTNVTHRVT